MLPQVKQGILLTIPVFRAERGSFNSIKVNSIPLRIVSEVGAKALFKKALPALRNRGIHAFPHMNRLYFVASREFDCVAALQEELEAALNNVPATSIEYNKERIEVEELKPVEKVQHFIVVRGIVYSYLRYLGSQRVKDLRSRFEHHGREGLTLYVEEISSSVGGIVFRKGLKFLLEVLGDGSARLWYDLVVRCWSIEKYRYLSPQEMKRVGVYDEYRKFSVLNSKERYDEAHRILRNLGFNNGIELRVKIYDSNVNSFSDYIIQFHPSEVFSALHNEPKRTGITP